MANSFDPLNPEVWRSTVQDYLNKMLVAEKIANRKNEALLNDGDTVNFPELTDVRVQSYAQGTDLTIDEKTATQSQLLINQSKAATFPLDKVQEKQARANYALDLAFQSAFQLKNNIDQTVINTGVNGANDTVAGGTLSVSTMLSKMGDVHAQLARNNAVDAGLFGVIDPERQALLTQTFVSNGFVEADSKLKNQFAGRAQGFQIFVSNNLPSSVTLQMATIPTATDTLTIYGVTWTWVANGAASAAGDISIDVSVANAKANWLLAVAGTAAGSASTYIDVSTDNRITLQNAQVSAAAWSNDESVLTGFGKVGAAETFTDGTDTWGTETSNMLFGRMGAVSLAMQLQPSLTIAQEPKQLVKNYITHVLYGTKVFSKDAKRLVNMSYNV